MNICDENIDAIQRQQLRNWKIHYRHIGTEIGRKGMKDRNDIIPLLHHLHQPTFFTRDQDFYKLDLRHSGYCLAYFDVLPEETAEYIRRFLRHSGFKTRAKRMGKVIHVRPGGISWWEMTLNAERALSW